MGFLTAPTVKNEFKIEDGGRPPCSKPLNRRICATVRPILMRFGTVTHIGPLQRTGVVAHGRYSQRYSLRGSGDTCHERRVMAEGEETQSQAVQNVDHSRHAGVLSERHDPRTAGLVHHPLVVDQTDVLRYTHIIISTVVSGGSVAEWLACWTQAQKGPGSNRSRDAVG